MLPQRRISPRMPAGAPAMSSRGLPSKAMKKAPPKKPPTSFFGEKKYWSKPQMREKIKKLSPFILKGRTIPRREREQMVERWFPYKRFGTHVHEGEVKRRLRELRGMEYRAKTGKEKKAYGTQRKLLEAFTGVRKY